MARRGFALLFTLLGIAFFISMAGFALLYLAFGREPAVPSNATLVLRVGGSLSEVAPNDVVGYLRGTRTPTVRGVVDNLRKAKVDSRVRAVMLKPTGFDSPFWGKVQEIRDAVLDFKKSGKPIYAYVEYGGDREYYLATAADKVFLMPSSPLNLAGIATYELFLRGTFDKIGVYPDLHRIGATAAFCGRTRCAPAWSTMWRTKIRWTRRCARARSARTWTPTITRASVSPRSA